MTSTVLRAPASRPATGAPAWSARACSDSDYDDVLAFFSEPDFFFRTAEPDTRSEWEIRKLVGADTRLAAGSRIFKVLAWIRPGFSRSACTSTQICVARSRPRKAIGNS